jgi:VWFA-related protein
MRLFKDLKQSLVALTLFALLFSATPLLPAQQRQEQKDDVVRVFTELVQTDVMVFDKSGNFVKDLRPEDFELRIDGKPRPIEFFERVTAGSANEETQLAAARGERRATGTVSPVPLDRGRAVFFYLDDLHLDLSATQLTRRMVTQYIDREMSQNDQAAITSTSGQIGFLQQLTDNKVVLRKALERLKPRTTRVTDIQRPAMSEYQAFLIGRFDLDVTSYFSDALLRETPGLSRESADQMVQQRAQQIIAQSANITRATLSGLESLIKSSSKLPGRKLVFFISNGFFIDERNADSYLRLQRVTSAAARNGVVIYALDARGLVGPLANASTESAFDVSGRLDRANQGELIASQDALTALAADTGGRAVFNSNVLEPGMKRALNETSTYYLLAWKPESASSRSDRFRKIEVKLIRKSNLTVRVRRGFYEVDPAIDESDKTTSTTKPQTSEANLISVINAPFPDHTLPVSLNLAHVNMPREGDLLAISLLVPGEYLTFQPDVSNQQKALVQVSGNLHNARGDIGSSFSEKLTVSTAASPGKPDDKRRGLDIGYRFPVIVKPGLYQARVGVLDLVSGKAGSAHAWIEIPDISTKELAMSSLLVGERESSDVTSSSTASKDAAVAEDAKQVDVSVHRQFRRDSFLRFLLFIYNATVSPDKTTDIAIQVQITRDDQPVLTTPLRRASMEDVTDFARLPYAAEIPLDNLPLGHYVLIVTALDRMSKRSTSQQTRFQIVE